MNRAINIFSFIVSLVYMALAGAIVYDLSFSSMWTLKAMSYKEEILGGLAVVILLLGLIRVKRRWQGIKDMKNFSKFSFDCLISKESMKDSIVFTSIELVFTLAFMAFTLKMSELQPEYTIPMIAVLGILASEAIFFLIRLLSGGSAFKLGVNKEVVAYFNREMHLYYYTGLKRIELKQKDLINFQYKEDLNIYLPTAVIQKKDRVQFRDALIETLADKNVYIDDAFRAWE
ncbi:hypothetical protein JYT72_00680 [Crocinitomix catalasitica]|nr:hypothetical protein [Crocinitomix catalasitica]